MYCEKCCMIVEEGRRCPVCRSQKVRAPQADDGCFLTELQGIWCGMLEDVLKQEQIPYYCKRTRNIVVTVIFGEQAEGYRFYVPYARLDEAKDIVAGLFQEESES